MGIEVWVFLLSSALLIFLLVRRVLAVNQPLLSNESCEAAAPIVIEAIFEVAGSAGAQVPISEQLWKGLKRDQWIYLCRWMDARGLVMLPEDWGLSGIMLGAPPETMALTQRSWELEMDARRKPGISIQNNSGNINIDGVQINLAARELSAEVLERIAASLRLDAKNLSPLNASQAVEAADSLEAAVSGAIEADSPEVKDALRWVQKRVGEAVGNAAGSALFAATLAALRSVGLVS